MKVKQTLLSLGILTAVVGTPILMPSVALADCGGAKTSIINCDARNDSGKVEDNAIWKLLLITLNIMIAGVGVLAVTGVVYGAVLYTTAADRPEQIKKAKETITNVVIGVLAFGLMYSLLNFLIPGGVFNG